MRAGEGRPGGYLQGAPHHRLHQLRPRLGRADGEARETTIAIIGWRLDEDSSAPVSWLAC